MKRTIAIATLGAALALPLAAQVRLGGGRPAAPAAPVRIAPAPQRTMAPTFTGPVFRGNFTPPVFSNPDPFVFTNRCDPFVFQCSPSSISDFRASQQLRRLHRRRFVPFNSFGFLPAISYATAPYDYMPQVQAQPAPQPIIIYAVPPPQPQPEPAPAAEPPRVPREEEPRAEENLPPVILVFRDHRREEVSNYVISGDTLYVLLPRGRRKIALSDLDLPATEKVNDDRGVDFRVPRS